MSVLLVGIDPIPEIHDLADAIESRGGEATVRDVTDWPGAPLTFSPGDETVTLGSSIDVNEIEGVYLHVYALFRPDGVTYLDGFEPDEEVGPALTRLRDHRSVVESLCRVFESRDVPVLPRLRNHYLQQRKPWQLERFEQAGLPVPETRFTNEPAVARSFCASHDRVIYKPVTRGAPPAEVTEADLTDERLQHLETAPVQFQEFVPGDDLRVYVLDGEVIGSIRYLSEQFSFKLDQADGKDAEAESATIPSEIEATAIRAADALDVTFGAADIRHRPDGGHTLLELNQAPAFSAADAYAGQDVAGSLARYLLED